MKIKNIEWLSKEAKEAEVIINDGIYECVCFCHPCAKLKGEIISDPITAFDVENVIKVDSKIEPKIEKITDTMSYKVIGHLINLNPNVISVGNIKINIGNYIPKDIYKDDLISFQCNRLDI